DVQSRWTRVFERRQRDWFCLGSPVSKSDLQRLSLWRKPTRPKNEMQLPRRPWSCENDPGCRFANGEVRTRGAAGDSLPICMCRQALIRYYITIFPAPAAAWNTDPALGHRPVTRSPSESPADYRYCQALLLILSPQFTHLHHI